MKSPKLLFIVASTLSIFGASTIAQANDVSIRVSGRSVHSQVNLETNNSNIDFGGGYMYHDGSRHIVNADLHATGQTAIANLPTTVGVGGQVNYFNDDDYDGTAVAMGGFAKVNIPDVPGLSFESALHYAPSILSFGDSDNMTRFRIQGNYRVIQTAEVFTGYHYLNSGIDGGSSKTLDSGVFIGMKLIF